MNDLINKKRIMAHIESQHRQWGDDYDALQILGDIEDAPTIETEPVKHGKWIAVTYGDMRCSCCGGVYGVCGGLMGDYNYCPGCGAKMDSKE